MSSFRNALPRWYSTVLELGHQVRSTGRDREQRPRRATARRHRDQTGNLLGIPATGKPIRWDAVDIYRVTDAGKISEQWTFEDLTAITGQLGAVKLPWAG